MYFGSWDESLFILSTIFFVMHKLLSLIRAHLFIFTFVSFALGDGSKIVAMICVKECKIHQSPRTMEDLHVSARATHLQKEPQDLPDMVKV